MQVLINFQGLQIMLLNLFTLPITNSLLGLESHGKTSLSHILDRLLLLSAMLLHHLSNFLNFFVLSLKFFIILGCHKILKFWGLFLFLLLHWFSSGSFLFLIFNRLLLY